MRAQAEELPDEIRVSTEAVQIRHLKKNGGALASIVFAKGSGSNLLRAPLTSYIRCLNAAGESSDYRESNDPAPLFKLERSASGIPVVVAEGVYRNERGQSLPVGFRRRSEYHDNGLLWSTLEIMSDCGCPDTVELRVVELALRAGLTDCSVRLHPTQGGGADLLGAGAMFDLRGGGDARTVFLSRFTPSQIRCSDRGSEGIDLFHGADFAAWDCSCKPEPGLGFYHVSNSRDGSRVELSPYCMVYRRIRTKLQGKLTFRLGVGLPTLQSKRALSTAVRPLAGAQGWSGQDAADLASSRVQCVRYHNPLWRAGVYPPFDPGAMQALRGAIDAVHGRGIKVVVHVSPREFHPDTPEFAKAAGGWMHMAAPSLEMIRNWNAGRDCGALMCLSSGWLDFAKRYVDRVMADLPWDGLFIDAPVPLACCHPAHGRGPYHTDAEGLLDFISYCRQKTGTNGLLLLKRVPGGLIVGENLADAVVD
jgi:hypothetical protein